jgi:thiol-disulfide isomerase/thioredoxin
MKYLGSKSIATIVWLTGLALLLVGNPMSLNAADLAGDTNISMYPHPVHISNLVLKSSSGHNVSLSSFRGKVVLLHFWSIQCPACRMEEPLLENLQRKFGRNGLEVLGVNLVDPPQAVINYATTNRMPFPVLFDGGAGFSLKIVELNGKRTAFLVNPEQQAILEVPGFPTTYILNCHGSAIGYSIGATPWNKAATMGLLRGLMSDHKTCSGPRS